MRTKFVKGSEEFTFFADLYLMVQDFYTPEKNDKYWQDLMDRANDISFKYKDCEFSDLANRLVLSFLDYQDDKYKEIKNELSEMLFDKV